MKGERAGQGGHMQNMLLLRGSYMAILIMACISLIWSCVLNLDTSHIGLSVTIRTSSHGTWSLYFNI